MENFIDKLRDYEWDLVNDLWAWAVDTGGYWLQVTGWTAWLYIALVVVILGLSLDLTHNLTSLVLARTWGVLSYLFFGTFGMAGVLLGLVSKNFVMARLRDSTRFLRDQKNRPDEG